MENKYFNEACDILDTAVVVAAESGATLDQALQAMQIAAIMKGFDSIAEELSSIDASLTYGQN